MAISSRFASRLPTRSSMTARVPAPDTVAGAGDRPRLGAGRAARLRPGSLPLPGRRIRLAYDGAPPERPAAIRTSIDGLGIHFLHVRSPEPDALPLVLTHGWPGSIVEFLEILDPLADPAAHGGSAADAFHVVCPSLPGFGFSDKPARAGWGIERIADAWAALMARLGYARYGAQGGDWGTSISTLLGQRHRAHVAGIHLTPPLAPPDPATLDQLTERERSALAALEHASEWDSGYSREHSTRPQTIGYALV